MRQPSEVCSAGSADSISDSSAPGSRSRGSAKPTCSVGASSANTGPTSPATRTYDASVWPTPNALNGVKSASSLYDEADQRKKQIDLQMAVRAVSTCSSVGSPVRTSVMPDYELVWTGPDPGSGLSSTDVLANFDRALSSWRTSAGSLFEASIAFSDAWPIEGMTRSGRLFARPMLVRRIAASASLSSPTWLTQNATPDATSNNGSNAGRPATGKSLLDQVRRDWPTPQSREGDDSCRTMPSQETAAKRFAEGRRNLDDAVALWPTPIMEDSESRTANGTLTDAVREIWPTPTVMDAAGFTGRPDEGRTSPNSGRTLLGAAMDFPTPAARDFRAPNRRSYRERGGGSKGEQLNNFAAGLHDQESRSTTGSQPASSPRPVLNPRWVAALMGFPVDWLDGVEPRLRRLATRSSQTSPKSSRGGSATSCEAGNNEMER
jgi:hypothetical protein